MIADKDISATTVASLALWIIGGGFVVVGAFFALWFTGVGIWLSGVGGVLWIRRMLCCDSERRRMAFDMGREYERSCGSVRSLH